MNYTRVNTDFKGQSTDCPFYSTLPSFPRHPRIPSYIVFWEVLEFVPVPEGIRLRIPTHSQTVLFFTGSSLNKVPLSCHTSFRDYHSLRYKNGFHPLEGERFNTSVISH